MFSMTSSEFFKTFTDILAYWRGTPYFERLIGTEEKSRDSSATTRMIHECGLFDNCRDLIKVVDNVTRITREHHQGNTFRASKFAAATIYVSAKISGVNVNTKEFCSKLGISYVTIKKHERVILNLLDHVVNKT